MKLYPSSLEYPRIPKILVKYIKVECFCQVLTLNFANMQKKNFSNKGDNPVKLLRRNETVLFHISQSVAREEAKAISTEFQPDEGHAAGGVLTVGRCDV